MNRKTLKIWGIITFTLAVIAIVIRAIWQIVVIPTGGTMLIFLPLIAALLGVDALFAYLVARPEKIRTTAFAIGITVALTAGLLAGVAHFVRFIISPLAEHYLCKVIGFLVVSSSVSAYGILLYIVWSLRKAKKDGNR